MQVQKDLHIHARKAYLKGLNPKENRNIPPLRYDLVKRLKDENPSLLIEINGGFTDINQCISGLKNFDGVMIGRSAYRYPLRWSEIDNKIYGEKFLPVKASDIIYSLIPYYENHLKKQKKSWDICKHLINIVESIPNAKIWRNKVSQISIKGSLSVEMLITFTNELKSMGY